MVKSRLFHEEYKEEVDGRRNVFCGKWEKGDWIAFTRLHLELQNYTMIKDQMCTRKAHRESLPRLLLIVRNNKFRGIY